MVRELREQLEGLQRALMAKQSELRTVLVQRDARIAEVMTLQRELERAQRELTDAARAHAARVQELEEALAQAQTRRAPADDLQLIRGIGPSFARELARLGVRTFDQIAAWSDDDVQTIAPQIRARADRILRDGWRDSAARLVSERDRR